MKTIVHDIGPDVHEDSIAVSIAPSDSTEVRRYGIIGGTLNAVDQPLRKHWHEDSNINHNAVIAAQTQDDPWAQTDAIEEKPPKTLSTQKAQWAQ